MVDPVSFGSVKPPAVKWVESDAQGARSRAPIDVSSKQIEGAKSPTKLLIMAKELAEAGPPVDYQKISQIRTAITQGTYKTSAEDVAAAMTGQDTKATE